MFGRYVIYSMLHLTDDLSWLRVVSNEGITICKAKERKRCREKVHNKLKVLILKLFLKTLQQQGLFDSYLNYPAYGFKAEQSS